MLLAHEFVDAGAAPQQWMLFLHGILGRRANWRSFARKWVAQRSGWGAVLVDLRDHGESQGLPGARTVAAAGADLVSLVEAVTQARGGRVAGVLGHSFGGKVAIEAAAALRAEGQGLDELWVVDSPPGPRTEPRDQTTDRVFATLKSLPASFDSRTAFVDAVVAAGIAKPVGQWLATNLARAPEADGQWVFGLDIERISSSLADFARVDLWPVLEAEARAGAQVALVLGERSEAVFGTQLERAKALAGQGRLRLETVPRAGHWVHVDNPAGLLAVLG